MRARATLSESEQWRFRRTLVLACLAMMAVVLVGMVWWSAIPRYQGRSAADWFGLALEDPDVVTRPYPDPPTELTGELVEAFRAMGAGGIEYLCDRMAFDLRPLHEFLLELEEEIRGELGIPRRPPNYESSVRGVSQALLLRMGPIVELELLKHTYDDESAHRAAAVTVLGDLATGNSEVEDRLIELLSDSDQEVVARTLEALTKIRPDPDRLLPLIVPILVGGTAWPRQEASYLISLLPPQPAVTQEALILALADKDKVVRANAARALGLSGRADPGVVKELRTFLVQGRSLQGGIALEALARLISLEELARIPGTGSLVRMSKGAINDETNLYIKLRIINARLAIGFDVERKDMAGIDLLMESRRPYRRVEALQCIGRYMSRHPAEVTEEMRSLIEHAAAEDPCGWVRREAAEIMHVARATLGGLGLQASSFESERVATVDAMVQFQSIETRLCGLDHHTGSDSVSCSRSGEFAVFKVVRFANVRRNLDHRDAMMATGSGLAVSVRIRDHQGNLVVDRDLEDEIRTIEPGESIPIGWELETVVVSERDHDFSHDRPIIHLGKWRGVASDRREEKKFERLLRTREIDDFLRQWVFPDRDPDEAVNQQKIDQEISTRP